MHMRTYHHHRMMIETSKTTNFPACFFYNIFYIGEETYYRYNFFVLASFFRRMKETNKTTNFEACFFYNSFFISIIKLITFPYWQVYPLWKISRQQTCLHRFCPIDNR